MDNIKSDYRKGLLYFGFLMVCISTTFTTPDGESIFHNFLGLFGISPGIPMGEHSTLYVFMLVPIIAGVICVKKVFRYWRGYRLKFKECNVLLRALPLVIVIPVLLLSNLIITPSGIDRIYFSVLSQRPGLQAVTFQPVSHLNYTFTGSDRTYSYNFNLTNHGDETVEFNVKLVYIDWSSRDHEFNYTEALITDNRAEAKEFVLLPGQSANFRGSFMTYLPMEADGGSFTGVFSVMLLNEYEQHSPTRLVRPQFGFDSNNPIPIQHW